MNKQAYLASLKRSLSGLPVDQVEDILRDYEQHFIDARAGGRSDEDTARALGDPRKIALEFKAMAHLDAFQNKHSLANLWRMVFALVCMVGFNMFLLPFLLVAPLMLLALYLASASCLVGGVLLTASGLLGVDQIAFEHEGTHMAVVVVKYAERSRLEQDGFGIQVSPYSIVYVAEPSTSERITPIGNAPSSDGIKALIGAMYAGAGIALFLLSQKLAAYLGSGARRYLNANANILRGAQRREPLVSSD